MLLRDDLLDAGASESLECGIRRVADTVAKEYENIARRDVDIELVEGSVVEGTQRQAGGLYDLGASSLAVNRSWQSRVGDAQRAIRSVPHRVDHGNVLRADGALGKRSVHQRQHLRRRGFAVRGGTQDARDQCRVERGGRAFTANIADTDRGRVARVLWELVHVAGD